MNYILISFDMDGTLLNSELTITSKTLNMIEKAHSAGKTVILATGRSLAELSDFIPVIPHLRYVICVSGAMVYDCMKKQVLFSDPIPADLVSEIMEKGRRDDVMIQFLSEASVIEEGKVHHLSRYGMGHHQPLYDRITTTVDDIFEYHGKRNRPVEKINFFTTSDDVRSEVKALLPASLLNLADGEGYTLEITSKGVSKAAGLKELCRLIGIKLSECIAVGDSDNDLEIIKAAGLGIAIGNATESILDIADAVVSDRDHDGCAEAIQKYLLGGPDV